MSELRIIPRAEHPISRGYIDPDALKVLYRLHRSGFKAFLVGGSVRDLMMGRTPKDFDVGTNAHPNEVRRLFRNCRVIGRRFRLAHVLFDGGKVIEVSTFRTRPEPEDPEGAGEAADLLIRSDNTFGTPEEDALRRDFTINGLFYDIATFAVLDYVGGVADLEQRVVRTIGDPAIRFREDPVRMMRACEFAARLDFQMAPRLRAALEENRREIRRSAAPRVTEELLDPLRRGWGAATYRLWSESGLLAEIFHELDREVGIRAPASPARTAFWRMIEDIDRRKAAGEGFSDPVLLGVLFLPLVFAAVRARPGTTSRLDPSRVLLVLEETVNPAAVRLSLPNAAIHEVKQALFTLGRLVETRPGDPLARRLVTKGYFTTALALLSLYASAAERYRDAAAAWEDVLARAGHRLRPGHDLLASVPFPEALVPLRQPSGRDEIPAAPDGDEKARRKGARRGGRRRRRGGEKRTAGGAG